MTKAAIQEFDWKIVPHPPYSPDLTPSDYVLFRSLSNNLRGVPFNSNTKLQNWLDEFFPAEPVDLLKRGFETCPNVGRQS
jgi:histone-lysine N-methyltransferase SETMAR